MSALAFGIDRTAPGGAPVVAAVDGSTAGAAADSRLARAWAVLASVEDPEVPVISVCELGIVREVIVTPAGLEVVLTPTYSGCPATEVIEQSVREALETAALGPVTVTQRRAPAWTTDWISEEGRRKLLAYGIVPPGPVGSPPGAGAGSTLNREAGVGSTSAPGAGAGSGPIPARVVPLRFMPRRPVVRLACPRCASVDTEQLAAFGSTACKALHRCRACGEPFEHFKPI